jgi:RNA polymerase sigma factor (sigma-70 family)
MATDSTVPDVVPSSEPLLATRIHVGDPHAEEELVNTYKRAVLVIALARTHDRDTANDLSQEILIAVLKALRAGQIRDGEKLGAFIQGTARNIINNYLRSRCRHPEVDIDGIEVAGADPVQKMESSERQRLMCEELARYSITDQKILLLSLVDGHSLAEVASRLHLSHDAVRARKSRLIRKITKKFQGMSQT